MSSKLTGKSPMAQMEEEKRLLLGRTRTATVQDRPPSPPRTIIKQIFREHKLKMKKMEKEMENVFETKVKEKKQKLKDSEHELTQKHKNVSFGRVTLLESVSLLYA